MKTKFCLLILLSFLAAPLFQYTATASEESAIIDYLKQTKETSENIIVNGALVSISDALWMEASVSYNIANNNWGGDPVTVLFYKKDGKISQISTEKAMIPASAEFLSTINKNYKLKTDEDAILFQTMLYQFDKENFAKGFSNKDNIWYFVRHEMFGDKDGFKVTTDGNGKVQKIEYFGNIKEEIPETRLSNKKSKMDKEKVLQMIFDKFSDVIKNQVEKKSENPFAAPAPKVKPSKKDAAEMQKFISNMLKEEFVIEKQASPNVKEITDISIYKAELTISHKTDENFYPTSQRALIISNGKEFSRAKYEMDLVSDPLFIKSLKKDFNLYEDKWVIAFEKALDEIKQGEKEALEILKKDNIIAFIREKDSDEKRGYLVLLDKKGKIIAVDYTSYEERSIIKLKSKDPSNIVDYKFKLEEPTQTKVTISATESVPVKITFDEKLTNANSGWILTQLNGKMMGMEVSSEGLKSPFTDKIPGEYLKSGKHLVEYILMPPGNNTEKAFAKIAIEVEVK